MRRILFNMVTKVYPLFLKYFYKMNIGNNTVISHRATLDKSINPRGVFIGENCWVLRNSMILAHDHCRKLKVNTVIGDNCVIGINSIILPGVNIGSHVVIGAGAVVTKDIPSHCIVAGNPAKIIREGIRLNNKGQLL